MKTDGIYIFFTAKDLQDLLAPYGCPYWIASVLEGDPFVAGNPLDHLWYIVHIRKGYTISSASYGQDPKETTISW